MTALRAAAPRARGGRACSALLDRWAARSRTGLWLRSLLSIYDLADLLPYDVPWWTFKASDQVERYLADAAGRPGLRVGLGRLDRLAVAARRLGDLGRARRRLGRDRPPGPARPTPPSGWWRRAPADRRRRGALGEGRLRRPGLRRVRRRRGRDRRPLRPDRRRRPGPERLLPPARSPGSRPDGVLVFDNVDRERYREAIAASPVPVDVEWTRGLTPALPYPTRTALVRAACRERLAAQALRGAVPRRGAGLRVARPARPVRRDRRRAGDTSVLGRLGALLLVWLGLTATGLLWLRLMPSLGAPLPLVDGSAIFFVGQLGKYIPGSVWSIGAQADLARRHAVPAAGHGRAGLCLPRLPRRHGVVLGGAAVCSRRSTRPGPPG